MNSSCTYRQVGTQTSSQMYKTPIDSSEETATKKPECSRPPSGEGQSHVHEFQGSTKLAEEKKDRHNHRFAGVSGQVIPFGNSHVHAVFTNTDFFEEHHHEVAGVSGPAIEVGNGKHIHFVKFITTIDDGHFHEYQFAFLIEDPLT